MVTGWDKAEAARLLSSDDFGLPELRRAGTSMMRARLEARGVDLSNMSDAEFQGLIIEYAAALVEAGMSPKEAADAVLAGLGGLKTRQ